MVAGPFRMPPTPAERAATAPRASHRIGGYALLGNFLGNQLVWLVAVDRAAAGLAWPGVVASGVFVSACLWAARTPRVEAQLIALALACGLVVDGVAAGSGWLVYAAPAPVTGLAPPWILALWASLAVTLNVSMRSLQQRPGIALMLGTVGGPLAYWAAARGWGAVEFADPPRAIALLAITWGLVLPGLLWAARRWNAIDTTPTSADTTHAH